MKLTAKLGKQADVAAPFYEDTMTHVELFPTGMILPENMAAHLRGLTCKQTFCCGRLGADSNEDDWCAIDSPQSHTVTVIDGVTATVQWRDDRKNRTTGQLAGEKLVDLLMRMRMCPFEAQRFLDGAHAAFQDIRTQTGRPEAVVGAVMAHLRIQDRAVYLFGDCKVGLTVETPDGLAWQNLTGLPEKGGNGDAERRIIKLKDLMAQPDNTDWADNPQTRQRLASLSWQAMQDGRKRRVGDNPLNVRSRYDAWFRRFDLPEKTRTVHLFSDGFLQAWPTLEAGRAFIAELKQRDPWMTGIFSPDLITPKCFVDDRTGDYVEQLDDMVGVIVPIRD